MCVTGAVGGEEEVPPLAGATLHPGEDDPGHLHPHIPLSGQLPQHQTVHLAMRERHAQRERERERERERGRERECCGLSISGRELLSSPRDWDQERLLRDDGDYYYFYFYYFDYYN